jgi:hypothetical protein
MPHVMLNGLAPSDYVSDGRIDIDLGDSPAPPPPRRAAMHDARPLQATAPSESRFFADHGFALLRHESAVRDWEPNPADPPNSEIGRIYVGEIDQVIRQCSPAGGRTTHQMGLRHSPGQL